MRRFLIPAAVALMLAAAVAILILGPRLIPEGDSKPAAARPGAGRAVPVLLEPVTLRAQAVAIEAVGTSRAARSVVLHAAAAGEVTQVAFKAGQRVEAGQVLVALDSRAETVQLELAKVRLADAERELERNQRMGKSGAVSAATLDAARTAVALARLEVERAEVALADRRVRAPFAGYVGLTDLDPGDRITPETAIASLDDRRTLLVRFEVPEAFFGRLKPGDPIDVNTWTAGDIHARGQISHIDTRVDPERRTFVVRARIDNEADQLRPGMSFRVNLRLEGRRYPAVPEVSLQWGDNGAYVWTVDGSRARRVPVTLVQRAEGRILVDGALTEGMPVITEGVQSVREGGAVAVQAGGR